MAIAGNTVHYSGDVGQFHDECAQVIQRALDTLGVPVRTRILQEDPQTGAIRVKAGMTFIWKEAASTYHDRYYRQTFHEDGAELYFTLETVLLLDDQAPDERTAWEPLGDSKAARSLVEPPLPASVNTRTSGIYGNYDAAAGF